MTVLQSTVTLPPFAEQLNNIFVPAILVFKASALWADAFYKSKCPSVCPSVCLFVCLFTFEVPFNGLFGPTSRNRMSNIFRDLESLGKSNEKKCLTFEHFCLEMV